jgi:hypothetical protein
MDIGARGITSRCHDGSIDRWGGDPKAAAQKGR